MDEHMRNEVERIIKEFSLDRKRVFEVSKLSYAKIKKQIEYTFVHHGKDIHWANMGNYKKHLPTLVINCSENMEWVTQLEEIIPQSDEPFYVLVEGDHNYWVYEMHTKELITILLEAYGLDDYYIVSKNSNGLSAKIIMQ